MQTQSLKTNGEAHKKIQVIDIENWIGDTFVLMITPMNNFVNMTEDEVISECKKLGKCTVAWQMRGLDLTNAVWESDALFHQERGCWEIGVIPRKEREYIKIGPEVKWISYQELWRVIMGKPTTS